MGMDFYGGVCYGVAQIKTITKPQKHNGKSSYPDDCVQRKKR